MMVILDFVDWRKKFSERRVVLDIIFHDVADTGDLPETSGLGGVILDLGLIYFKCINLYILYEME